jgi:prolyl-tRNA synthetase
MRHAIEAGHVFKLGTKYSEALGAKFLDASEQQHPIIMGCYGIGINRIIASLIETNYDENGIIWPVALAPYEVLVVPLKASDEATMKIAERLHDELSAAGIDVLMDDRDQRPGVKFKDADLIGIPLRVVVGERGLKQGQLEAKWRWDAESQMIDAATAVMTITDWIRQERQDGQRFRNRPGAV